MDITLKEVYAKQTYSRCEETKVMNSCTVIANLVCALVIALAKARGFYDLVSGAYGVSIISLNLSRNQCLNV